VFLSIRPDLSITLGNEAIARGELAAAIDAATQGDRQKRIFLRADKSVAYGALMDVMNLLRNAGYLKIALVGLDSATAEAPAEPRPAR
jgi:biopolymer transport protein ExbD